MCVCSVASVMSVSFRHYTYAYIFMNIHVSMYTCVCPCKLSIILYIYFIHVFYNCISHKFYYSNDICFWFKISNSMKVKVAQSVSDSLWPHGLSSAWNSPGRNTGVVAFPFSRVSSQPRFPALQVDSLPAEPQGKPFKLHKRVYTRWGSLLLSPYPHCFIVEDKLTKWLFVPGLGPLLSRPDTQFSCLIFTAGSPSLARSA